jgi:hypothetical protein
MSRCEAGQEASWLRKPVGTHYPRTGGRATLDATKGEVKGAFAAATASVVGEKKTIKRESSRHLAAGDANTMGPVLDHDYIRLELPSAIVGPWPDDASCRTALQHVLGETGFQLSAHIRGCSIARIRHIGTTSWISAEPALIVPLTDTLEAWQIFGVQVEYGPSGNRAVGVQLMRLDINDQRELVVAADLGSEPEDRDALDAALDWEIGLVTHWLELPDETPVTSTMIFYTEQRG